MLHRREPRFRNVGAGYFFAQNDPLLRGIPKRHYAVGAERVGIFFGRNLNHQHIFTLPELPGGQIGQQPPGVLYGVLVKYPFRRRIRRIIDRNLKKPGKTFEVRTVG